MNGPRLHLAPAEVLAVRARVAVAEAALDDALELIADLHDQLDAANAAAVRLARGRVAVSQLRAAA